MAGAGYSTHEIWISYKTGSTETVVETTYFKNAQVAFPAVLICQTSRVDWTKVEYLNESLVYICIVLDFILTFLMHIIIISPYHK